MTEYNLGRVAFLDQGVYSALASYNKWDFVTTIDSCYLYVNAAPSIGEPITNTDYWKCIADGKPSTLAAAAAAEITESATTAEGLRVEAEALRVTFMSAFLTTDTGEPIFDDNYNLITTL